MLLGRAFKLWNDDPECVGTVAATSTACSDEEVRLRHCGSLQRDAPLSRTEIHNLLEGLMEGLNGKAIKPCRPMTNNAGRLFHYRITVSPPTNFLVSF
ncbi:hypothetical protein P7K49_004573 [Saguinus oedipus]|uniref:Uncharacterized protein n=1 Tax=Saguinus oedipus TaxID=9490 RepID=A0ABQ9W7T4_SAGOE|nr:hypothetical protein P7K49_004573 [Saguinus oedipus]